MASKNEDEAGFMDLFIYSLYAATQNRTDTHPEGRNVQGMDLCTYVHMYLGTHRGREVHASKKDPKNLMQVHFSRQRNKTFPVQRYNQNWYFNNTWRIYILVTINDIKIVFENNRVPVGQQVQLEAVSQPDSQKYNKPLVGFESNGVG